MSEAKRLRLLAGALLLALSVTLTGACGAGATDEQKEEKKKEVEKKEEEDQEKKEEKQ